MARKIEILDEDRERRAIQSYLIFMALNLKRLGKLLAGVSFRSEVRASVMSG
jgi:hypothetical protein